MLFDTHCHLHYYHGDGTLDAVLAAAAAAGVTQLATIGIDEADWPVLRDLAAWSAGAGRKPTLTAEAGVVAPAPADIPPVRIFHTVGLHPCQVAADWEARVAQLPAFFETRTAGAPPPVALGEIGLDYYHLPKEAAEADALVVLQHAAFRAQLALARRFDAPVVIHARKAFADAVRLIDESGADWRRIVFHCFAEGADEVRELNRRGGRASFTATLTYGASAGSADKKVAERSRSRGVKHNSENVRAACLAQGLDRCMLETDAPYLVPEGVVARRGEPAFVRNTAEFAARLFGVPFEEVAVVTSANAREFYGLG